MTTDMPFLKKVCFGHVLSIFCQLPAASLKHRKQLLGLPIHIKMSLICINIGLYIRLVLNKVLYSNYIALAIDPFLG